MSKNNCIKKGYHEYSAWRKIEDNRVVCDMNGVSYHVAPFIYYVRNCKCCDALEAASNLAEKEFKTEKHNKVKKLSLSKIN